MHFTHLLYSLVLVTVSHGSPIPQFSSAVSAPSNTVSVDITSASLSSAATDSSVSTGVAPTLTAFTVESTFPASALSSVMATLSVVNETSLPAPTATTLPTSSTNDTSSFNTVSDAVTTTLSSTGDLSSDTATAVVTATSAPLPSASFVIPTNVPQACLAISTAPLYSSSYLTASAASPLSTASAIDAGSASSSVGGNATSSTSTGGSTASVASATSLTSTGGSTASVASATSLTSSSDPANVTATSLSSSSVALPSVTPTGLNFTDSGSQTITKRIAQDDLPDVAQSWQDLCLVSNGDIFTNEPCVQLAGVNGINALLANADPCAQQDNADAMVDFAKSPGVNNTDALIANAVAYIQHPRNALDISGIIPSNPYCQRAPRNPELMGLVNAQLPGANPGIFGGPTFGLVAFGDPSSCPYGTSPDVTTCECS